MPKRVLNPLTLAEEFYIEKNVNKSEAELVADLERPVKLIREHMHKTRSTSRINNLLIREKGCVIMTEGASMAGDEARKGYVSEQSIREAVAKGDFEEAARLQAIMKTQLRETKETLENHQAEHIHRINK